MNQFRRRNQKNKITKLEAREALLKSGYLMENRIESVLVMRGYYVEANTVYIDAITSKPRELDLLALQMHRIWQDDNSIWPRLIIECVNNPQPLVFITKDALLSSLQYSNCKIAGIPVKIPIDGEKDSWVSLGDFLDMDKYHHYCSNRIATQFCSFQRKKSDEAWMAINDEMDFDAFKKLTEAVDYLSNQHFRSFAFSEDESLNLEFYYPILIVHGQLMDARPDQQGVKLHSVDHIQYRHATIINKKEHDYQIDIIRESYLNKYLDIIDFEADKIRRKLLRKKGIIKKAIDEIVSRCKAAENSGDIVEIMDF